MTPKGIQARLRELTSALTVDDMPVATYVVTTDGAIVTANKRARELLGLPVAEPFDASIAELYTSPTRRAMLVDRLLENEASGGRLEKASVALSIGGRELHFRKFARTIRDSQNAEVLGYFCVLDDVTDQERTQQLFELLPIGAYRLDQNDHVAYCNQALANILGYHSPRELEGVSVATFYAEPQDIESLRNQLQSRGPVIDYVVTLLRRGGERIFASISANEIRSRDGLYLGREGTITDVTIQERYRRVMANVPIGVYECHGMDESATIVHCNQHYAHLLDAEDLTEIIGKRVSDLYSSPTDHARFIRALRKAADRGVALTGYRLAIKTVAGRRREIEVNSTVIRNAAGDIVGRTGAVRDVTAESALQSQLEELSTDFGSVLHRYSNALLHLNHLLPTYKFLFGPSPFPTAQPAADEVWETLIPEVDKLRHELHRMIADVSDRADFKAVRAVLQKVWEQLDLPQLKAIPHAANRVVGVRAVVQRVIEAVSAASLTGHYPRETVKSLRQHARRVLEICAHGSLGEAQQSIRDTDFDVRRFREYLMSGTRSREAPTIHTMFDIVSRSATQLADYAVERGVEIRQMVDRSLQVVGIERDLVTMVTNLIHNAIKYSWRKGDSRGWVTVRSNASGIAMTLEIENWGVPIPEDEIRQDLIFQTGFRGRLSGDRGRLGTGIGLTESRHIARRLGGDLVISSRPASDMDPDNLEQPFVTTASLHMPLAIPEKSS